LTTEISTTTKGDHGTNTAFHRAWRAMMAALSLHPQSIAIRLISQSLSRRQRFSNEMYDIMLGPA